MSWQLSTAGTEVLDDGRRWRYCLIIFAGCHLQPPPHRPMWSTFESTASGQRFVPHFSNYLLVFCSCDVTSAKPMTKPDCASASGQAQIRSCKHHRNHHAATATRLVRSRCVGRCAQRAHHHEQQRHRRSEWAGVSWPKDDEHERDATGGGALARRRGRPHGPITPQTLRSVRSSARWRGRPHVSASSGN